MGCYNNQERFKGWDNNRGSWSVS